MRGGLDEDCIAGRESMSLTELCCVYGGPGRFWQQEYPVSAVMFLSLGSLASFKIVINEVPPPEDEGSVIEYTPDEAAATTAAIVNVARAVVAKMPLYTPAAPASGGIDLSNMSPADQARELARQQREQIKASLTSTMGGGKFELTRRDGPRERD